MKCKECGEKLEVHRSCRRVRMRCISCKAEFQIHEVADQLDAETEEILAKYSTLIYD
ncbi:dual CXXC motif small (seleno)protein [Desulfotalea psychrophila]|uniref:dual CXXC motif small (seleno)protein n=1 Tax=Desulfotalea psychrophila TaxID=84980 RepID=UPI0002DEB2FB|nr:dual CXXC motif small (seleno)protein [Desulfotalea psychrophila]